MVGDNPPYTEFGADVGAALDTIGEDAVNEGTMGLAQAIAGILEAEGDTVTVVEPIIVTDFETPIFGAEADRERAMLMNVRARHLAQES